MYEKDFQTKFLRWIRHNEQFKTGAYELKITKTGSLPFNALRDHQLLALQQVKHRKLAYKIADDSIGFKPFDCFVLEYCPAYVVIMFYRRGTKEFFMIDIDIWTKETEISKRKSLTEDRAREIGITLSL